jgi:sugar/nucleoside kinase (ribokinase family)
MLIYLKTCATALAAECAGADVEDESGAARSSAAHAASRHPDRTPSPWTTEAAATKANAAGSTTKRAP